MAGVEAKVRTAMKDLVIGIGCRRGVSATQIQAAVFAALAHRSLEQVRALASIESKADEAGLLEFAASHGLALSYFSRDQLAQVDTAPSAKVHEHIGVGGVCEACALLASHDGYLIIPKLVVDGVTVAIASDHALTHV
jgi:cobalt-precorrin 5A hydrolase